LDSVAVHTTQNVVIDYVPAGLGNRILAGLLDFIFKFAYLVTILIVLYSTDAFSVQSQTVYALIMVLIFAPWLFYDLLFEIFMQGQTLGKKILKLKVVKLDGTQPSVGSYILRWLLRIVEIDISYSMIAVVAIASSKNRQRLGDMAAGTTVIAIKPPVTLKDMILQAEQKEGYKVVFPEVINLTEKDIELMKEVYDFYMKVGNTDALHKLAEKIRQKAGIKTDMKDGELIATLMKDYSHYKWTD
jgi:uncharacterized RDD family membrane protein YckC